MKGNEQILCNEELLMELREIEKAAVCGTAGSENNVEAWTEGTHQFLTILCC